MVKNRVLRFEPYCLGKILYRLLKIAPTSVDIAPVVVGVSKPWFQAYGFTIIFKSLIHVSLHVVGNASVEESVRVVPVETYSLIVIRDGVIKVHFSTVSKPAVEISNRVSGVNPKARSCNP